MTADTEGELHAMAGLLKMKQTWFQNGKYPHYDLTAGKRYDALHFGAQEITTREWIKRQRRVVSRW